MSYDRFESGVSKYIIGKATVYVKFPVDFRGTADCSCNQCKFFRRQSRKCALNDEIIAYPDHYVGQNCPLRIETEDEE